MEQQEKPRIEAAQLEDTWRAVIDEYMLYLQLERAFTKSTLYAYEHDIVPLRARHPSEVPL